MRDKHYKIKTIRISEELWQSLKKARKASDLSWNLFLKQLYDTKGKI
jgi:hypothetical protein